MKYIITESRLENIIFKYLDDKLNGFEWRKGQYSDIVLALHGEEYGLMGWEKHDKLYVLYVHWEFVDEIKLMFSMLESESLDVIGRYVESRYNLKVNHTHGFDRNHFHTLRVDS
jgi:hypothetical protein